MTITVCTNLGKKFVSVCGVLVHIIHLHKASVKHLCSGIGKFII